VKASRASLVAFLVVLAVGTGLRAYQIGAECFDGDELYAVRIQGIGPKAVAAVMVRDSFHGVHPPLMSVPFLAWTALFGTAEAAVRGLPLLAGTVALAAVYAFGCALGRPRAGLFGAALLAMNPLHITYSMEARSYALVTALLAVAQLLFVLVLQRNTRALVLAYFAVAWWSASTHYFAVPVLIGQAAAAAWLVRAPGPQRPPAARLLLAVALAGLPYLAWLPAIHSQTRETSDYLAPLTPAAFAASLADALALGGWGSEAGLALSVAALGLAAAGAWAATRVRVAVIATGSQLLPRWLAPAMLAIGSAGGIGFVSLFPSLFEPTARQTLTDYGYGDAVIDAEIGSLWLMVLLGFGCIAIAGTVLAGWRRWEPGLRGARGGGEASVGVVLAFFLIAPVAAIALVGASGVAFHQTRNLIVLLPAVSVAWGFALDRMARTIPGSIAALVVVAGMVFAAAQYHAVARVVGRDGPRLGMSTIDWRGVHANLRDRAPAGAAVVMVNRPATDPGLYYLAAFEPMRIAPGAPATTLPERVAFVHMVANPFSDAAREQVAVARGPLALLASGDGWELHATR